MTLPIISDDVLRDLQAGLRGLDALPNTISVDAPSGANATVDVAIVAAAYKTILDLFDLGARLDRLDEIKVLNRRARVHLRLGDADTAMRLINEATRLIQRAGF